MPDFTGVSGRRSRAAGDRHVARVAATARAVRRGVARHDAFAVHDVVTLFSDHARRGRVRHVYPGGEYEVGWDTKPVFVGIYLEDELELVDSDGPERSV